MAKDYNSDRKPHPWGAPLKIVGCISPVVGCTFCFGVHLLFYPYFSS